MDRANADGPADLVGDALPAGSAVIVESAVAAGSSVSAESAVAGPAVAGESIMHGWPVMPETSVVPGGSAMPGGSAVPSAAKCRIREILGRIGDKWSLFIIFQLGDGPQRFTALKRAVDGISQRMLTVTLRGLERDGIVSRTMYPVMPPRVDYALTPLGHTLLDAVGALMAWVDEHLAEVDAARDAYDARSSRDVAELPVPAPARSQEAGASRVLRQPGLTSPT